MSAVMPGSSAPNGSSSSRIFGSRITDCAIDSRCCMPPESCAGYLSRADAGRSTPAARSPCRARARRCAPNSRPSQREPRELEPEQHVLEHASDAGTASSAGTRCRDPGSARAGIGLPSISSWPRVGCLDAEQHLQERRLAAARRADDRDELVIGDVEVQVLQHDLIAVLLPQTLCTVTCAMVSAPSRPTGTGARARSAAASPSRTRAAVIHTTYGRITSIAR